MTITITEEFREKVDKAARSVAGRNNQVEWEDVRQDVWVRLLEDPQDYSRLCEMDDPFTSLKRIAKQEIYKQNSALEHFSGNYTYTPGEVRGLLNEYLVEVTLESLAENVDLVEGVLMLKGSNSTYFKVLVDKYVWGIDPKHPENLARAVEKLTQHMNQVNKAARYSYEGPGNRKILSNAQAQARKEHEWS